MSMEEVYLSYSPEQALRVRAVRAAVQSARFDVCERNLDRITGAAFFIACTANDELQRALEQVRSGARDRSWLVALPLDGAEIPAGAEDVTWLTGIGDLVRHLTRSYGVQGDAQAQNVYGPDVELNGVKGDADDMRGENIRGSVGVGDVVVDHKLVITGVNVTLRKRTP